MDIKSTASDAAHHANSPAVRPVRVAVIVASNREGRFAPVISQWFLSRAEDFGGLEIDVVDVADITLPTALAFRPSDAVRAERSRIGARLTAADAFVVITPEYNHSYPAGLKNLIDWYGTEWHAKPVGFVSYGGLSGGLRAVEHLRQVFAELHAVTIRDTVSFHGPWGQFDDDGRHTDPDECNTAAKSLLDKLSWWALALRDAKSVRPFAA
ncbi:NADPH-dependent FMN reductase [Streptomyces sp. NPDC004111]|uniref:NADPH-dependent FMN reductase n=1 Tax=Streptomyces sp. NPDC004111 TaxID=3364690 RepID=UPI003684C09F